MADKSARKFDEWSHNGKAEDMQKGHANSVEKMLESVRFDKDQFSFLDIGCGNGWVVRKVASDNAGCRQSVGIDKSAGMTRRASEHPQNTGVERYTCADIESFTYGGPKFDYAFAMESIYYVSSIESALANIHRLLRPDGIFLCGMDFYAENTATKRWAAAMKITMHLHSKGEWRILFADAGFTTKMRHIKDAASKSAWKRNVGTLFITATKRHNTT